MKLFFKILSISLRPLFSENERPKNFEILFSLDSLLPSRVNKYFKSESFELDIFSFLRSSMTPLEPILLNLSKIVVKSLKLFLKPIFLEMS